MKTITRAICRTCGTDEPASMEQADRWADKHLREHPDHEISTPTTPAEEKTR